MHFLFARKFFGVCVLLALTLAVFSARAQFGVPDSSYEHTGVQMLDLGGGLASSTTVLQQPDGKVLVGGNYGGFAASRYFADGRVDSAFGYRGIANFPQGQPTGTALQALLQPDGKILFLGSRYIAGGFFDTTVLARMTVSGKPDSSFGVGGVLTTGTMVPYFLGRTVILQPDGKLLVGGIQRVNSVSYWAVFRLKHNQTLDSTFGIAGVVRARVQSASFGYAESLRALALQPDGKIVAGGVSNNRNALVRFLATGMVDSSFGVHGRVVAENYHSSVSSGVCSTNVVVVQADGKIIAGGVGVPGYPNMSGGQFGLMRFTTAGVVDSSYCVNGRVITELHNTRRSVINSMALQSDGKLVATGTVGNFHPATAYEFRSRYAVLRYNTNGTPDSGFAAAGILLDSFSNYCDLGNWVHLQQDGKLLVASSRIDSESFDPAPFQTARYLPNGSPDSSFNFSGKKERLGGAAGNEVVNAIFPLADGRILAGGGNQWQSSVVRRNGDGSPDTTFAARGILQLPRRGLFRAMVRYPDGRFAVVQERLYDTLAVWRFLPDGAPDLAFGVAGEQRMAVSISGYHPPVAALQPDGKILLAFTRDEHMTLLRLTTSGALDATFGNAGIRPVHFSNPLRPEEISSVYTLAVQPDGKILVGGSAEDYHTFQTDEDFALARLLPTGAPDVSFGGDGLVTTDRTPFTSTREVIYSVGLQSDGKIVALQNGFGFQRFLPNGTPDSSFGTASFALTPLEEGWHANLYPLFDQYRLLIQPDDKLLVAAQNKPFTGPWPEDRRFAVMRCNANGTPDASFGTNGIVMPTLMRSRGNSASALALQMDGKFVVGGYAKGVWDEDFSIVRLTTGLTDGGWATQVPAVSQSKAFDAALFPNPTSSAATLVFTLRNSSPVVVIALRDLRGSMV